MLEFISITCPYCGESFETGVDASAGSTAYVEDCAVCCKPIEITLRVDGNDGSLEVEARGGDE
ncbi:MAG: CPXCG motif-containing cysteine-rich protein [Rhodanobacteraceae bacterium]